jgi:hypothetical protein
VKSNATGTYNVEFRDEDNARHIVGSYTINASGTWEKKTITVAGDTTAAFDNDNGMSLQMQFWLAAGSNYTSGTRPSAWASSTNANRAVGQTNLAAATNNYWQITGVQLEAGAVATPFEFEDYGVTLAKCQRYYQKSYLDTEAPGTGLASSMWFSATNGVDTSSVSIPHLRTTMRSSPTMTVYHAVNGNSGAVYRTTDAQSINVTSINYQGSNGGGWIDLATDAENGYLYHYVFSAEL